MNYNTLRLIENKEFYKKYLLRIKNLEKNMSNRTPSKIGLYCRYLRVSGKKGNNHIWCKYGQENPDLKECVECYGLAYSNGILGDLERDLINVKKEKRPQFEALTKAGIELREKWIVEHLEKSMLEFLENTKNV